MKFLTVCLLVALVAMIAKTYWFSFRFPSPDDYADTGLQFILTKHLSGEFLSEGLIFGPEGKMANNFVARMTGEWEGRTGTLTEDFTYSNGTIQS